MATNIAGPDQLLCDIQVTGLSAGQTAFESQSGVTNTSGQNSIQMTPNSVGVTQPITGITYWHALWFDYEEGVLNPGQVYPDIQMTVKVDTIDYSSYINFDLSQPRNMLPHWAKTSGHRYIMLGNSMINAALNRNFGGNAPLEFLGWKSGQGIDFVFSSTSGFTTSSTDTSKTFASPPTLKLWGDVYDADLWRWLVDRLGAWRGDISMSSARRAIKGLPPYVLTNDLNNPYRVAGAHSLGGADINNLSEVFEKLPDGPKQGTVKVHRFARWATPIIAAAGTAPFILSNKATQINGKPGNVGQNNELAWVYSGTKNAVRISRFGRQPAAGTGYFGLAKGQTDIWPRDTTYGVVDTVGNPRAWYGYAKAYTNKDEFFVLPPNFGWVPKAYPEEVIAGENAGYFVAAQNGQTIAANTDYTAVIGAMVEA